MTNLLLRINNSAVDNPYVTSPSNFITVAADDTFIFSAGSALVANGQPIPSQADLNRAATLLSPTLATIVAHYFLGDTSLNLLKEIYLAGNGNNRYAFCCSFDGATASEPQLEAWDDSDLDSYSLTCLGSGNPANSWYKAKCTTSLAPGATWTGTPLGGSGASNIILLNDGAGALTVAKDLYFNFHVNIPAGVTTPGQYLPVLVVTYATN
jgi:hypothetical protein